MNQDPGWTQTSKGDDDDGDDPIINRGIEFKESEKIKAEKATTTPPQRGHN